MWKSLLGTMEIQITCADIASVLNTLSAGNCLLMNVNYRDGMTFSATIRRQDYFSIRRLIQKAGGNCKILGKQGIFWPIVSLRKRPILVIGLLLYLITVFYVPSRVFFVRVEGNNQVPDRMIIEAAEKCGISFGTNRRQVRSERVKNALLEALPELQWVGVNTSGCVAVISVRERNLTDNKPIAKPGSIIAARDGVVRACTVLRGTQLCKVGQVVKAGEVLVSGYKDYGIAVKFGIAEAEVLAETKREMEAVTPTVFEERTIMTGKDTKYSLQIGKKVINFFQDSGISHTECVKIYKKTYLSLPGGFVLPIAFISQEITYYETVQGAEEFEPAHLSAFASAYLEKQMVGGTILSEQTEILQGDGCFRLTGKYACLEMIGITKYEE